MDNFWNKRYITEQLIWGVEPSSITVICEKIFKENNTKDILVIGAGYGRNGKYFVENGYHVDGIEISEEAINIGKIFAPEINFIKGSVLDMNLNKKYDAVFCYDIIQLFQEEKRKTVIENCIKHCKNTGRIMISCLSDKDMLYGIGKMIEGNTFEIRNGLTIHFSNEEEINNIGEKLEIMKLGYSKEKMENDRTGKERDRIYGIYKIT
ncbi:MAG: class I SAM-dependent methyltransferase [Treponema sp.]|jgi:2-polyprenyl-3-methyl-5-hydroxy-6-metoxy-1,4-benzoquinol methylase|nr:class I SAM-dependent methyltransferase [Treponema sp.]